MRIAACVKWVDTRPEIDPLTGEVHTDDRSCGVSRADQAAVELAARLAEAWGGDLELVTAGPPGADAMLRELGAIGATRLVRVDLDVVTDSAWVAHALAPVLDGVDVVVCGDHSLDRGSGAVPAFIAHVRGAAQALGLTSVEVGPPGELVGTSRLGGGRAQRVRITAPAVVSVEGAVAVLRRAPLSGVLAAGEAPVERVDPRDLPAPRAEPTQPLVPRTRRVPAPVAEAARDRIVELTGALVDRTPPRTVVATPDEAADLILTQLRSWGYLE